MSSPRFTFRSRLRVSLAATVAGSLVMAPAAVAEDAAADSAAASAAHTVEFSVTNFTDLHGHFVEDAKKQEIGTAKLASLVKKVNEGQDYVLTSSGDSVGGSAFVSSVAEDMPTMTMLNALGVQATAVGNHELDKGIDDLQGRISENSDYPLLAANIYKDGKRVLPASEVQEINGVTVGFVGSVTDETPTIVAPEGIKGLEFRDAVEETNAEAKRLKDSGEADVVIALFHDDVEEHKAEFTGDVDVVFGGHSHKQAMGEVARDGQLPLYYAQGFEFGKVLNDYDFTFNTQTKKLESVTGEQYTYEDAEALSPDASIAAMVTAAQEEAQELGQKKIGHIDAPLRKAGVSGAEGSFSNVIATAQRGFMEKKTGRPVDLGIMNEGGVRTEFEAGDVTYADALTAQPFDNDLQVGTLTGQNIIDIIELQWRKGQDNPTILGFSDGFSYAYDASAEPGERFLSATINGKPLDPQATYTVAAAAFLFGGGDGFSPMKEAKDIVKPGVKDVEALIEHLGANPAAPQAQVNVGVTLPEKFVAGQQASIELSSLNFAGEGDAMAQQATVQLGEAKVSAEINNEEVDPQRGNLGSATVDIDVPAGASGEQMLIITTDAGTEVRVPVTVEAAEGAGGEDDEDGENGAGSQDSSSTPGAIAGGIAGGLAGIIALIIGLGAAAYQAGLLPKEVQDQITRLRGLLGV
ncbi:MAG: bifunctional UDP-sugar hydrolase/5'-nucleotidase [Actinomycetaceae bacterium]|nr:bifunctional UDP-sugar hydrolase/5'-nucleotidase [Actinomycetaceae bacterium]